MTDSGDHDSSSASKSAATGEPAATADATAREQRLFEWRHEQHTVLTQEEQESERSFDKAVLTFASVALGYTVSALPCPTTWEFSALFLARIGFAVSIGAILVAYRLNSRAIRIQREIVEAQYNAARDRQRAPDSTKCNPYPSWITAMNTVSLTFLIAAVTAFAVHTSVYPASACEIRNEVGTGNSQKHVQEGNHVER